MASTASWCPLFDDNSERYKMKLTITEIGGNLGIIFPSALLARHQLKTGDRLHCPDVSTGGKTVSPDADLEEIMEIVERIMREDHEVLRRLAE